MMVRRCCALAVCLAVLLSLQAVSRAQIGPGEEVDLRQTLESGLKVRVNRERRFVARVVALVQREVFQRELVLAIFQKARFRHRRFPFVYFRVMMQGIARDRNIDLPF